MRRRNGSWDEEVTAEDIEEADAFWAELFDERAAPFEPEDTTYHEQAAPAPPNPAAVHRYGCHPLQRGDKDRNPADHNRPRWGGRDGAPNHVCAPPAPAPAPAPGPVAPANHVRQLQEDLRTLGFLIIGAPDGNFGRTTEWAVREFQIYAKMEQVARVRPTAPANLRRGAHLVAADNGHHAASNTSDYVHSLERIPNGARYAHAVSGVVNAQTRTAIDHWLRNDYRCPVVVEAWTMRAGRRASPAAVNLWAHDSHPHAGPRMFVRDFTGYYTMPAGHNANDMHVIGDYASFMTWSGPRSSPPRHTWAEGELLPAGLTGTAAPAGAELSTYRVVRAVSEVECIGFFDSVNAYDNAFISVGPCHWTLGITNRAGRVSRGELCGYLAYLRHADPPAFRKAFEFFGMRATGSWVSRAGPADGADVFRSGSRKYSSAVALQRDGGGFRAVPLQEAEWNYLKNWHWFYRYVMAGRTVAGYRRRMWDMARIRVRDIRDTPWGAGVPRVGTGAAARAAKIGDIVTSERGLALLLRWHIRAPAHVIARGNAGARLQAVLATAQRTGAALNWTTDPTTWTNAHEQHLIDAILTEGPASFASARTRAGFQRSLRSVNNWPTWLAGNNPRGYALAAPTAARLSANRGSLNFHTAGLPPAPP